MKKNLFFILMAGVALAGCVSNEVSSVSEDNAPKALTFSSPVMYSNSTSRAAHYGEIGLHVYGTTSYSYPREENFVIYAIQHAGDFAGWAAGTAHEINNTAISYDPSVDGWAPKTSEGKYYYWPEGKMSFAASSPADLENTAVRNYGANGLTITGFEISADPSKQYDLLFSTRTVNKTSADMQHGASKYSGLPIQFQHALSSVRFSIKNETEAEVVLTGIKVYGVKYKGDFAENITENAEDYTQYVRGTNVNPAWTPTEDLVAEDDAYTAFEGRVTFPIEAQYVLNLSEADTDEPGEEDDVNPLLLLPQTLVDNAVVEVHYTVDGNPHNKVAQLNLGETLNTETPITEWQMGYRYTYRLVYTSSTAARDKIYFAPESDKWEDEEVIVVEL